MKNVINVFKDLKCLTRHLKSKTPCNLKIIDEFEKDSKMFTSKQNIMQRLYAKYPEYFIGIDVYFPHFIAFDFEALNMRINIKKGENTKYYKEHIPLSVSIGSNIDNKIKFFYASNENEIDGMMRNLVDYANNLSDEYYNKTIEKLKPLINEKLTYYNKDKSRRRIKAIPENIMN